MRRREGIERWRRGERDGGKESSEGVLQREREKGRSERGV